MRIHNVAAFDELRDPLADVGDPELRRGLRELFRQTQELIDEGEVQAVVLAARRLACVYQILVDAGGPSLRGAVVVSDRSMDISLDADMRGVLILDDSVVLGTTLHGLATSVRQRCPKAEVIVKCVVVDREQRVDFLLEGVTFAAMAERDADGVRRFSSDLVHCLFQHQVPFFSDFPISTTLRVDGAAWVRHLHTPGWLVADVTPPLLDDPGLQALAHVPGDDARGALLRRLSPEVAELVDAFKVRSYTRVDGDHVDVVLVPLALLAPATTATVMEALRALARARKLKDTAWEHWDIKTQQRLLQYFASVCLLAEYRQLLDGSRPSCNDLLAPVPFSLFFGVLAEDMRAFLDALVADFLTADPASRDAPLQLRVDLPRPSPLLSDPGVQELLFSTRELLSAVGIPPRPDVGQLTKIGLLFAHAIASIFGYVDETLEAAERRLIAGFHDAEQYEHWRATGNGRILDQGFTLGELTQALVPDAVATDAWARSLVAFGLDIGNDLGIIVPVTQVDTERSIVYRCYRLGETAFLANRPLPSLMANIGGSVQDVGEMLDEMSAALAHGYPVHHNVVVLDEAVTVQPDTAPRATSTPEAVLATVAAVLTALPGVLVEGWNGVITHVADDGFVEADLRPVHPAHPILIRLPLVWIVHNERPHVRAGRRLVWSVWERERAGAKTRSSRLRLLPVPPVDLDRAQAIGASVQTFLQDDDDYA